MLTTFKEGVMYALRELTQQDGWKTRACFSNVPKLFGCISGGIILFVYSKRRRLEARHCAVIYIFIPFTTYEKTYLVPGQLGSI